MTDPHSLQVIDTIASSSQKALDTIKKYIDLSPMMESLVYRQIREAATHSANMAFMAAEDINKEPVRGSFYNWLEREMKYAK